jgi:hypothetical protein
VGGGNEQLAKVLGEPQPTAVLMLPIRLKERTVAFLMGDNPGESTDSRTFGALWPSQILGKVIGTIAR